MPAPRSSGGSRFELKYVIPEDCARACRDFARSYLVPDPHADPAKGYSYPIHSVYLDDPACSLARGTIDGLKNRFKLRVRYYDSKPASPVFFEIKRRVNDVILKERAMVCRAEATRLLAGEWPESADLVNPANQRHLHALHRFCDLALRIRAQGCAIVSYQREAWVSPDNEAIRVTFDRHLVATPFTGELLEGDFERGLRPQIGGVVLELKFTDRYPGWMRELVRVFNLRRTSLPKYVECLYSLDGRRMAGARRLEGRG
jgi:hypothetical protein